MDMNNYVFYVLWKMIKLYKWTHKKWYWKNKVVGFSKSLAREVASRGITVNTVSPGFIATDMTNALTEEQKKNTLASVPAGRLGSTEEIAAVVSFLASDGASYITGETLHNVNNQGKLKSLKYGQPLV